MSRLLAVPAILLLYSSTAAAQSFEVSAHVAASQWSEFEGADTGVGGRLTWKAVPAIGVDADVSWYPAAFPDDPPAFSGSRIEGLLGVTAGPRLGAVRPFARAAAGFLRSSGAPEPFACIAIFPPPLACLMAGGQTLPALEIGGGVELSTTGRTFIRLDAGARMLRYPAPTFRSEPLRIAEEEYWGSALRLAIGAGVRF
jgi:hypothetical protein